MNEKITVRICEEEIHARPSQNFTHHFDIEFHEAINGCRLICVQADDACYPECREIELPSAQAGSSIGIDIDYFTKEEKGCFDVLWHIEDLQGNQLFPSYPYSFGIRVHIQ